MNTRKINLNIEPVPGIYKNTERCDLAIISIAPRSEVVIGYLKSKLLSHKFLISKFQNNLSTVIKNYFNEKEITFLLLNPLDVQNFYTKMIRISCQFPDTSLFLKGKTKGYCFLDWKDKSVLETVKSGDFFDELLKWNDGVFLFQDLNFLQPN